ncbi:MAG: Wzz/FepE/Etk N-terminal domain-containing protein [Steroidobacteraceae bacterium]
MSVAAQPLDLDEAFDVRAFFAGLWIRRWWIAGSVVLFTVVFTIVAFTTRPIYRTATVFVPSGVARQGMSGILGGALGSLGDLASLAGVNVGPGGTETEEGLAVLKSRHFTEAFIQDKHLMPELFDQKWDAARQQWKPDVRPPTPAQAYKYFNNNVRTVIEDKKTGLIALQIDWHDRNEAAEWANELLRRLNAEMRERAIGKADASIGYLEKELNATTVVASRDAISRLIEVQIKQRMLANVTEEYAFRVVDRAMSPDKIDVFKPKKALMMITGFCLGGALGVAAVLLFDGVGGKRRGGRSGT